MPKKCLDFTLRASLNMNSRGRIKKLPIPVRIEQNDEYIITRNGVEIQE